MSPIVRLAALFRRHRMAGGWVDEHVAADVLIELGLDEDGNPLVVEPPPTSSNLGHG
jgi:hypothetical protein